MEILQANEERDFKCGEIFYLSSSYYNVACCLCGTKVEFDGFREHFKEQHASEPDRRLSKVDENITEEDPHPEPLKSEEDDIKCEKEESVAGRSEFDPNSSFDLLDETSRSKDDSRNDSENSKMDEEVENSKVKSDQDGGSLYSCTMCDRSYKSKRARWNHFNLHHNPTKPRDPSSGRKHKCNICGDRFRMEKTYKRHKQEHKEKGEIKMCSMMKTEERDPIKSDDDESVGEDNGDSETMYGDEFVDEEPIDYDTLEKMNDLTNVGSSTALTSDEWHVEENKDSQNDSADEKESSDDEDDDKSKDVESPVMLKCSKCDRGYASKRSLSYHIRTIHNPSYKRGAPKLKFKCEECGEQFRSEKHLSGHKWKHTGIVCDICGKKFTQAGNMKRHKIRHTGIKAFECKECDKRFFLEKELNSHMLCHSKFLPVICEVCGRQCRDNYKLTDHMRRHTGERPAKCDVCGKSFFTFYDLSVHAVTHTNDRPFSCEICGSTFQLKKALRVHKKIHNKDQPKPFVCDICGKAFAYEKGLSAHMRSHEAAYKTILSF